MTMSPLRETLRRSAQKDVSRSDIMKYSLAISQRLANKGVVSDLGQTGNVWQIVNDEKRGPSLIIIGRTKQQEGNPSRYDGQILVLSAQKNLLMLSTGAGHLDFWGGGGKSALVVDTLDKPFTKECWADRSAIAESIWEWVSVHKADRVVPHETGLLARKPKEP